MVLNIISRKMYETMQQESISCPLCGTHEASRIHTGDRFGMGLETSLCLRCGFLYTNPRPTEEAMAAFYRDHYRRLYAGSQDPLEDDLSGSPVRRRAEFLLDMLSPHLHDHPGAAVLDIGCGAGVLLGLVRGRFPGTTLAGVEPDGSHAAFARQNSGANVHEQPFEQWLSGSAHKRYDLIVLNHVLEHLHRPVRALEALAALLKEDGRILIEVPEADSRRWPDTLDMFHLAHLGHFTESTLAFALSKAGLAAGPTLRRSTSEPWAMAVLCRKTTSPKEGATLSPDKTKVLLKYWQGRLRRAEAQKKLEGALRRWRLGAAALKFRNYCGHHGAHAALKKTLCYGLDVIERAAAPAVKKIFGPYVLFKRRRARRQAQPILRRLIEGQRVLILGSGPSATELGEPPEDMLLFTCNQGVRLAGNLKASRIDLYLCTVSKIRRFPLINRLFQTLSVRVAALDDPSSAKRDPVLGRAFERTVEDDGEDPAYLEKLIAPLRPGAIRGSSHHTWTSSGIRLLQLALFFGAKEIYLAGIDLGQKGYAWGANPEPWFHEDIDENFLAIVRERYANVFSACEGSPVRRFFPYRPLVSDRAQAVLK